MRTALDSTNSSADPPIVKLGVLLMAPVTLPDIGVSRKIRPIALLLVKTVLNIGDDCAHFTH